MQTEKIEHLKNTKDQKELIWKLILAAGIFVIILGMTAILLPFAATITIEAIIIAILIVAALIHVVRAFELWQIKTSLSRLISGSVYGFAGIMLAAFPLGGVMSLTVLIAMAFLILSTFKISFALFIRPYGRWWWLLVNGMISALLALIIWKGMPATAKWALGFLVGVEMLFCGWGITMLAISRKEKSYQ